MKILSEMAKNSLPDQSEGKIVHMIAVLGGWKKLDNPIMSTDLQCLICGNHGHYTPLIDPAKGKERVWICMDGLCASNNVKKSTPCGYIPSTSKRGLEWAEFIDLNGIGDVYDDVLFENVKQADAKISYMLKFANDPKGIILMRGDPGTGKTYAALAICEMFTRKNSSLLFISQKQLAQQWQDAFKNGTEPLGSYIQRVANRTLLVIDDFGTGEVPPGFMSFFMDIINTRLQWRSRGTVITTNLNGPDLNSLCGEALMDRLMTGQTMEFKGTTRRKKTIL